MKKKCHVDLPNVEKSEITAMKQAAEIQDTSLRKFIKHAAIDRAKKILAENKR